MANKSFVWNYASKDGNFAICVECKAKLKCEGGSTSGIKKHLKIVHSITENNCSNDSESSQPSTVSKKSPKFSAEDINYRVVKMIAINQMPISFVASDGFKILAELFPDYVPIKEEAAKRILQNIYNEVSHVIKERLNNCEYVAFTTDIWTSVANKSYLTVVVHCIDDVWNLERYTLDTVLITDHHTGANIAEKIIELKSKWVENAHISGIVTDNAKNMLCAIRTIEDIEFNDKITCAAHSLQLVINKAIDCEEINILLSKVSKLVAHFKHSPLATEELNKKQQQLSLTPQKLIQHTKTRWNSVFMMLERLVENRVPILNVLADRQVSLPK